MAPVQIQLNPGRQEILTSKPVMSQYRFVGINDGGASMEKSTEEGEWKRATGRTLTRRNVV